MDLDLLAKLVGSLALVIGLLLATLYVLKRQGLSVTGALQVESSVSIGPKERIILIRCQDTQILVGVTSSNIRTLHVLAPGHATDANSEISTTADVQDQNTALDAREGDAS